jgi:argininosuccinate synthase
LFSIRFFGSEEKAMKKVVLVYSGGLDTSICIPMMREEYGYDEVYTVTVDVGQPQSDIDQAAEKAAAMGTIHRTVDAKDEFARDFCFAALKANGDYQGYPMSTSIARPIIAAKAVEVAREVGATSFAHGCTGKGNDQFRIEFTIRTMIHGRLSTRKSTMFRFSRASKRSGVSTRIFGAARSKADGSKNPTLLLPKRSFSGR